MVGVLSAWSKTERKRARSEQACPQRSPEKERKGLKADSVSANSAVNKIEGSEDLTALLGVFVIFCKISGPKVKYLYARLKTSS